MHSQVDDVNSLPEVIDVTVTSSEEHKLEECTKSIDDVLHKFNDDIESVDDVTITYSAPLEATEKDLPNPATPYGDIVVYDVSEDGNLIIENDPNDEQPIPRSVRSRLFIHAREVHIPPLSYYTTLFGFYFKPFVK